MKIKINNKYYLPIDIFVKQDRNQNGGLRNVWLEYILYHINNDSIVLMKEKDKNFNNFMLCYFKEGNISINDLFKSKNLIRDGFKGIFDIDLDDLDNEYQEFKNPVFPWNVR